MATLSAVPATKISGGSFLIGERKPEDVFTPEDFTEQHLLIAQTAEEFANKEIVPNIEKMERKDFAVTRELVKKAGELGLSGVDVPEQYGGMELDKVTSAIIADRRDEQAFSFRRRGRNNHFQARRMNEICFIAVGVMLRRADATPIWNAHG